MDKDYWNSYYEKNLSPLDPSDFAKKVINYIEPNKCLLEIGCGNGRDSIYFSNYDINIIAIDQSETAIYKLKQHNYKNINFIRDNFVTSDIYKNNKFDYVYSRFTLHSISELEQEKLFDNVFYSLNNGGILFIEARSVNDVIYGLGTKVEKNAYIYNEHYRRFLVIDEIVYTLERRGFKIIFAKESNNWAIYGSENPFVLRIYAKKLD